MKGEEQPPERGGEEVQGEEQPPERGGEEVQGEEILFSLLRVSLVLLTCSLN